EFALVNGEKLILDYPDVLRTGNIKYIVVESLFFKNQRLDTTSKNFLERLNMLLKVQSKGVQILSVEYIDNGNPIDKSNSERIKNYIALAKKYNFLYYVARMDMKLNTFNIPRIMD
ncbi:MAG: glycoside hydrolase, partial [Fervidobacterium sp.]